MFIPWWAIIIDGLLLVYLVLMNAHLHKRVRRLEKMCRHLEGVSDNEVKKQIKERMLQYDDGGGN
jgi:hypothetical protein